MSVPRRLVCLTAVVVAGAIGFPQAASAHGGVDDSVVTNYRTRVQQMEPAVDGVQVEVIGGEGLVVVTNTGDAEVVVYGYVGEPYLRISNDGVFTNLNSPATYVNDRRDANVEVPTEVSPTDPPRWEQISAGRTARWHDHRVHWMGTVPPANVEADPDSFHVVIDRWELPMTVGGTAVVVTGDTVWIPPPNRTAWLLAAVLVFAVAILTLQWRPGAAWLAAGWGALGTAAAVTVATGRAGALENSGSSRAWLFLVPAAALALTVIAAMGARRSPTIRPPVLGLGLVLLGNGIAHWSFLGYSQITSTVDATANRSCVIAQLGIGAALAGAWLIERLSGLRQLEDTAGSAAPEATPAPIS